MMLQYVVGFLIGFVCFYALIDRICHCIEHCSTARAISRCKNRSARNLLEEIGINWDDFVAELTKNEVSGDERAKENEQK